MHCIVGWNLEGAPEAAEAAEASLRACLQALPSVEVLPRMQVITVYGHGQQERLLRELAEVAAAHPEADLSYIVSPLIIGGLYQGRLFDADLAARVNRLADEPDTPS
jgi:hypothetical protein